MRRRLAKKFSRIGYATIFRISSAVIRTYRDTGQKMVYVEWIDTNGERGRTEGRIVNNRIGLHMKELLRRAKREGIKIRRERW